MTAPVALFVYNRPWHAQQTVEALRSNALAPDTDLHVFSDGAKTPAAAPQVAEVRRFVRAVDGFKSVSIVERDRNLGLAGSIIDGVTRLVNAHGRVIVLEDDLVTSPFFLEFVNRGLDLYETDEEVIGVHGYTYPVFGDLPETFFVRGADCWGWGTWKRGWSLFEADAGKLWEEMKRRGLRREFDLGGAIQYTRMLKQQIDGKGESWAIRWHATAFLGGKLTLNPGRSLVQNIGHDQSGVHCSTEDAFNTRLSDRPIVVERIPREEDMGARELIRRFFAARSTSLASKAVGRITRLARSIR